MIYKWTYEEPTADETAAATALAREVNIHPALGRLLLKRGIKTATEARRFFRPQLSDLHDPFLMNDMQVAVDRLNQALGRKEHIMVYGDYDVDGCTAVALVYKFLSQFYSNIDFYIPDRYEEGYGISRKGIDFAAEMGVKLIIVLDCGIKAVEEVAYAREKGIDFIICDHHVPDDELPPAVAILNPKRHDNRYPYTHLSGCGVGFKFMQAFATSNGIEFNKLSSLLDLCAVSIASDIVPIMGENRILACQGLRCLNTNPSIGLRAIVEVCGLSERELSMSDIIFKIGPRINASGRMQNGKEAVELLVEKDYQAALEKAGCINLYNEARKDLDKQMTEEAIEQVKELPQLDERRSIVIYNEEWHKGVIGIVASRLTEQYYRPAVVLTRSEDMATGSARSVTGFDVYKAVQSCADLLENFGGHTYAAGLTLRWDDIPAFRKRFHKLVYLFHGHRSRRHFVRPTVRGRACRRGYFVEVHKRLADNSQKLVCIKFFHHFAYCERTSESRRQLHEKFCTRLMKFGHPLFQILKHFLVLVQPLPEHRVVNGLTSRHNKPGVVLCNFHDEARAVFVEMVLLHPAEEVCAAHAR